MSVPLASAVHEQGDGVPAVRLVLVLLLEHLPDLSGAIPAPAVAVVLSQHLRAEPGVPPAGDRREEAIVTFLRPHLVGHPEVRVGVRGVHVGLGSRAAAEAVGREDEEAELIHVHDAWLGVCRILFGHQCLHVFPLIVNGVC